MIGHFVNRRVSKKPITDLLMTAGDLVQNRCQNVSVWRQTVHPFAAVFKRQSRMDIVDVNAWHYGHLMNAAQEEKQPDMLLMNPGGDFGLKFIKLKAFAGNRPGWKLQGFCLLQTCRVSNRG